MRWLLNKAVNLKEIRRMPQKRLPYYCVRDHPGSPPDSLTLPILTWLLVPRYILLEARDGAVFLLHHHHNNHLRLPQSNYWYYSARVAFFQTLNKEEGQTILVFGTKSQKLISYRIFSVYQKIQRLYI